MTKQVQVSREDISAFSVLLSGYIEKHFMSEWGEEGKMSDAELNKMHDFICRRIGMYTPITVVP